MKNDIQQALRIWYQATLQPLKTIQNILDLPHKISIGFWVNIIFAALYTVTVILYYFVIGRTPAFPPWIPLPAESYYLYQIFWTIPWGLTTWIMISGTSHLVARIGKKNPGRYTYDNALLVCGLGWVVPNLLCMWIPETILVPIFGVFWPGWVEILRLAVIPPLWQTLFVGAGMRELYDLGWMKSLAIGLLSVVLFFIMFLAFMR